MRTLCVILLLCTSGYGGQIVLDVPAYYWYGGCTATGGGMVAGYWDAYGYPNLIVGSNSWQTNQVNVKAAIASAGYFRDWWPKPDRVATATDPYHPDDSIADFLKTSRGGFDPGWGPGVMGLDNYAKWRGYTYASQVASWGMPKWADYIASINEGRPVMLGWIDHIVVGIGYDSGNGYYAELDDFTSVPVWKSWGSIVYSSFFDPGPLPGDANVDGKIDGADLSLWQQHYDPLGTNPGDKWDWGDWNGDRKIDGADLALWQQNYAPLGYGFGIPEPATLALVGTAALIVVGIGRRSRYG